MNRLTPTAHQASRIAEAVAWWNLPKGSPSYNNLVFQGAAGTGKTFCVKEILKQLPSATPLVTASTQEAVHQLELAGTKAVTCHSALTLRPDTSKEVPQFVKTVYGALPAFDGVNLLLVEESSMVGKQESMVGYKENSEGTTPQIIDYIYDESVRTMWIGDSYQLPPVGAVSGRAPIFHEGHTTVSLTEVVRNSGEVLQFCTQLRGIIDTPVRRMPKQYCVPTITSEQLYSDCSLSTPFLDKFLHEDLVVVTWRNEVCRLLNSKLRRNYFGTASLHNSIMVGDRLKLTSPLRVGKFPTKIEDLLSDKGLRTGATVNSNAEVKKVAIGELYSVECFLSEVAIDGGLVELAYFPTCKGEERLKLMLQRITVEARASSGSKAAKLWETRHALQSCFCKFVYAFVITANRSQGSTRKNVIANLPDILSNRNQAEAYRRAYTACSRASESLTVVRG
jgi:hypothetical protein